VRSRSPHRQPHTPRRAATTLTPPRPTTDCASTQIKDNLGNLQYIPFPTCNETQLPLSFPFATPRTQTCTIDSLPDELYHLLEFFIHDDVPLSCRVPSYSLSPLHDQPTTFGTSTGSSSSSDTTQWTPLTIALQGTLQFSHIHLHTDLNVLLHTWPAYHHSERFALDRSRLVAATAYSVPNTSSGAPIEGTKVFRNEPLTFTFNVGWVEGTVLPGMAGRPVLGVRDHGIGFTLFSFFALAAAAGVGAIGMLVYERRKSGRSMNGLLGGNMGAMNGTRMSNGYGGYGGYGGYTAGKRD
jgi:hypothetical protein